MLTEILNHWRISRNRAKHTPKGYTFLRNFKKSNKKTVEEITQKDIFPEKLFAFSEAAFNRETGHLEPEKFALYIQTEERNNQEGRFFYQYNSNKIKKKQQQAICR
jgi:hypothetical protein